MQVVKGILGEKYQNWKRVKASDKNKQKNSKFFWPILGFFTFFPLPL